VDGPWTIQVVGNALDEVWNPNPGDTMVELPAFRHRAREFQPQAGWERRDYDDSTWEKVYAVREGAMFVHASPVLLRGVLPPGAKAIETPLPVPGEYVLYMNGIELEKHLGLPPRPGRIDLSEGVGKTGWQPQGRKALGMVEPDHGHRLAESANHPQPVRQAQGSAALEAATRKADASRGSVEAVTGFGDVIAIETTSHSGPAGLQKPLRVVCGPVRVDRLQPWSKWDLPWYCGRVLYRTEVNIPQSGPRERRFLDLGEVQHYAEVWLNGRLVGTLPWPPYRIDVTGHLKQGRNELALVVSNSLANRFAWDLWGTRGTGKPEPSGLLGPVQILAEKDGL
jgi:hypothetical protein